MQQRSTEVLVIGAGPAGLAVGACLRRAGVSFTILERHDAVGPAWRSHYRRLHLHTDKRHSALPFLPFPKACPRYPSRLEVVAYLEAYANVFGLTPRFGEHVRSVRRDGGVWAVETQQARYEASRVVVATGHAREPFVPTWSGSASFSGPLIHSSQYVDGQPFRGQRVLVVGFGNSAGEIALDLCEHGAETQIAVRGAVNVIPREIAGVPVLAIGIGAGLLPAPVADALTAPVLRALYGDLARYGLRKLPYGPLTQIRRHGQIPLIDIGTMALIRSGRLPVRSGIERFAGSEVHFRDGHRDSFDAVIAATGYRPRLDAFLQDADGILDEEGAPTRQAVAEARGLYFCGFHVSPTGMLREIAREAKRIAQAIAGAPAASRSH